MTVLCVLMILSAMLGLEPLLAQTVEEPLPSTLHDEVLVTANRVEEKFDEVAGNVTIFTRQDIEQSAAQTLDDFLRQVPGFSLFRRSSSIVAHPTTQGVSLRGISPSGVSRTLVLLDGVPVNDPFGGWVYWSRIPLESIEQIEILRGGGSNVWGNYALGGVINIATRQITEDHLAAAVEVGNQSDLLVDVYGGQKGERLGWSIEAGYFQTDGYEIVREDQRGEIDIEAFSEHVYLSPRVDYEVSPHAKLSFYGSYFEEERGNGTPLTNNDTEAGQLGASGEFNTAGGSAWQVSLFARDQTFASTFSAQETDRSRERPALDQFAVDATDIGSSAQWTKGVATKHLLTAGADLRWVDGQTNEDFFWDGTSFLRQRQAGGDQQLAGLFLQDLLALTDNLQITLSARYDYWKNSDGFRLETDRAGGNIRRSEVFDDRNDTAVSPKLAALYKLTERTSIRGSLYQSFRAPTINELYRPFRVRNDITEANAELVSETLGGAEVGFDYSGPRYFARLTAFWNRVDDPIANVTIAAAEGAGVIDPCGFVPAGGSCRQRQNLGQTRIVGFEAELEVNLAESWGLSASYLNSDGEVVDSPNQPALEGKAIAQVPEHQFTLGVVYDNPRLFGSRLQTRYVGAQFEDDLNSRELDDFVVVDLSFWKKIRANVDLILGVENLFDETFEVGKSADGLVTIGSPLRVHLGVRLR